MKDNALRTSVIYCSIDSARQSSNCLSGFNRCGNVQDSVFKSVSLSSRYEMLSWLVSSRYYRPNWDYVDKMKIRPWVSVCRPCIWNKSNS